MNVLKLVENTLASTTESLLNLNLAELGIKSTITIENHEIFIHLCANFPAQFLKDTLLPQLNETLANALPQYQFVITIDHFIKAHRTQIVGKGLRGIKNTIAIASGKGGVGKSTVTVNLAIALARAGARVGILDADIYGPSIPLMMGKTKSVQIRNEHYLPVFAHGVWAMSIGYLTEGEPALIWRGPMLAKSLIQMLDITQWDELDYLLIDLPPGTGDIQLSLVQKIPLTGAVVVTTPQTVATLDAEKSIKMFARTNIDVLGIIENMSIHICTQCGHQEAIFTQNGAKNISEKYNIPLLGQLPLNTNITQGCEHGRPTAIENNELSTIFIKTALKTVIELAKKPLNYADKFPNIVIE